MSRLKLLRGLALAISAGSGFLYGYGVHLRSQRAPGWELWIAVGPALFIAALTIIWTPYILKRRRQRRSR